VALADDWRKNQLAAFIYCSTPFHRFIRIAQYRQHVQALLAFVHGMDGCNVQLYDKPVRVDVQLIQHVETTAQFATRSATLVHSQPKQAHSAQAEYVIQQAIATQRYDKDDDVFCRISFHNFFPFVLFNESI
jgi:hypothetical protein